MPIFANKEFSVLFVHIPKTGGGSFVKFFESNNFTSLFQMNGLPPQPSLVVSPQHADILSLEALVKFDELDLIFTIVRNPYDRLLSEYRWRHRCEVDKPDLNEWLNDSLDQLSELETCWDSHLRPMHKFLSPTIPCKIFKYENNLDIACHYIISRLNCDLPLPVLQVVHDSKKFHRGSDRLSPESFSSESISRINQIYRQDFLSFGYQMIDPSGSCEFARVLNSASLAFSDDFENASIYFDWHYSTLVDSLRHAQRASNLLCENSRIAEESVFRLTERLDVEIQQNKVLLSERNSEIRSATEKLGLQILELDSRCEVLIASAERTKQDFDQKVLLQSQQDHIKLTALENKYMDQINILRKELDSSKDTSLVSKQEYISQIEELRKSLNISQESTSSYEVKLNKLQDDIVKLNSVLSGKNAELQEAIDKSLNLEELLNDSRSLFDQVVKKMHLCQNDLEKYYESLNESKLLISKYENALAKSLALSLQ